MGNNKKYHSFLGRTIINNSTIVTHSAALGIGTWPEALPNVLSVPPTPKFNVIRGSRLLFGIYGIRIF